MCRYRTRRRGATVLEMAIILMMFLILTFGMLDLGVGMFRYHILSQAARHGARQAIVHGELADQLGTWGPDTIDVNANSGGVPIVAAVQPMLVGCDLDASQIRAEWLDGSNEFERRVRVTITSPYTPLFSFIFPDGQVILTASSTMRIAH